MTWRSVLVLVAVLAAAGCGSARRGEPLVGTPLLSPAGQRGELAFMRHCHQCHPKGEAGLGPSINDKPLPGFLMKFQVRHGLGAMPSFPPAVVGGQELDDIVAYLQAIR